MDLSVASALLHQQDGVLSRAQAQQCGLDDDDLERLIRRRELARVHPGVYVDRTGPPSWPQLAWAALLFHAPAALADVSALRAHGIRSVPGASGSAAGQGTVHIAVDASRRVVPPPGVVVVRRAGLERRALMNLSPPRLRPEEALLDVASGCADESDAVSVLADACQTGATTAARLHATLVARPRLPRRRLLLAVLDDVAGGALSVLERRYLALVERAHGLPVAGRQVRVVLRAGVTYRDVDYARQGVVLELDGRFVHRGPDREWADLERDVGCLVRGDAPVRLGWNHVLAPCRLAVLVGALLQARGWQGSVRSCGACAAARAGAG